MRRDGNRSAEKLKSEIAGAERIRRQRSRLRQGFLLRARLRRDETERQAEVGGQRTDRAKAEVEEFIQKVCRTRCGYRSMPTR